MIRARAGRRPDHPYAFLTSLLVLVFMGRIHFPPATPLPSKLFFLKRTSVGLSKLMPIRALLLTSVCLLFVYASLWQTQGGGASSTPNSPAPAADTDSADPGQTDSESFPVFTAC